MPTRVSRVRAAPIADGAANCRSARLATGREKRMPIPAVAGFGKAAQPLGVAADCFDGLGGGNKRPSAVALRAMAGQAGREWHGG